MLGVRGRVLPGARSTTALVLAAILTNDTTALFGCTLDSFEYNDDAKKISSCSKIGDEWRVEAR